MARPAREQIIQLVTGDIAEVSMRDLRSWVGHVVVHSMLSTRAGTRIDRLKLGDLVESHFDKLLHGDHFDFAPILAALLRIPDVTEADLYVGVVSLIGQFANMGLTMEEPRFKLDAGEKSVLIDEAYNETVHAREEHEEARLHRAVHEFKTKRLGELLVEAGHLDEQQLDEGLEAQREMGGRLGSNLVRMGFITEEELARFLSRQLGLPCITRLERVSPAAIRRLPKALASKYQAVPISVTERDLGVAMADPSNLEAMDEISFTTGLRVRPAVAPELLIQYALARFYGLRPPMRIRRLDVHRARAGSADLVPGLVSLDLDLLTADIAEDWDEAPPQGDNLAGCAAALANATRPSDVLDILGRFLAEQFATSAVFRLDGTHAKGFSASGVPQGGNPFETVEVDVHDVPVLSDVFLRRGLFVGAEPDGKSWVCKALHLPVESLLTIMPVMEHDRIGAILVGNARRKHSEDTIADDQSLAQIGSLALSMAALRKGLFAAAAGQR